ncbi:MAG: hypothetical protein LJE60_03865 [Thiocapsa sp.]|nr:hypothetical protein [Thiocapsa sp.]MCG6896230.1 hypothetical protein [Thiocapsa sp.]
MPERLSPPEPAADLPRHFLLRLWSYFWNSIVRVLWLCAYASVSAAGVVILFLFNDQGRDLLRLSAERGLALWNLLFLLGAFLLGVVLWYTARRLLDRDFRGQTFSRKASAFGREWWPRVFCFLVPFSIGIGFFRVDTDARVAAWVLGVLFLLLAAALMWFLATRRDRFLGGSRVGLEVADEQGLNRIDWTLISAAFVVSITLVAAFLVWPVHAPQALGTPAIMLLGFAGIALFGGLILTYAMLANGQPAGTALALAVAVACGFFNDNHWIRTEQQAPALERLPAAVHYQTWRQANPAPVAIGGREPLILVAAAGGGIRAAYWTASTLAVMESIPGFSDNLFAISGVSGGSVGAAVYAAIRRMQLEPGAPPDPATLERVREVLSGDFLSPVVAGLLFPDLIQRFVPVPAAAADRQRFLELAFERALGDGESPLSRPFTALYAGGFTTRLPSLLLNTTIVDSGRRAVISNIDLTGMTDTVDLLAPGFSTRGALLSAAAGASARFTYVSPAGSLRGPGLEGIQKARLVDGGYFENSGAATLTNLLDLIDQTRVFPILILIRNDPTAPPVCQDRPRPILTQSSNPLGPAAGDFLSEVASPVRALLHAREARGRLAEVDAARQVEGHAAWRVEQELEGAVIELSLAAVAQADLDKALAKARATSAGAELSSAQREAINRPLVEPPLGWSLSDSARRSMDRTLDSEAGGLSLELDNLRTVLAGQLDLYRRCHAE